MRQLLALLFVCWPSLLVAADDETLSIRIDAWKTGQIQYDESVQVVLTNHSNQPIYIWNPESKQGWDQLSFTFQDRKTREKYVVRKKQIEIIEDLEDYGNVGEIRDEARLTIKIDPKQQHKFEFELDDDVWWTGSPEPNRKNSFDVVVTVQSEIPFPGKEKVVWNGKIENKIIDVEFVAPSLTTPHDYLLHGFSDTAIEMMKDDPTWIMKKGDRTDTENVYPLDLAIECNAVKAVCWLMENGRENPLTKEDYQDLLYSTDEPEVVSLLLRQKPNLDEAPHIYAYNVRGTPLQTAASMFADAKSDWFRERKRAVAKLYIDAGAEYGIDSAALLNDLDRVKKILENSPKFDQIEGGSIALFYAAEYGHYETCKYLLENFDLDVDDIWGGGYPLIKVALKYPKIVKLLIDHGVDLKKRIRYQGASTGRGESLSDATALHHAVGSAPIETVKLLLDNGVDITARTKSEFSSGMGWTALQIASVTSTLTILRHPRFQEIDDQTRQSMLDESLVMNASQSLATCKLLLISGADPNAVYEGVSAAQAAAISRLRSIQNISSDDKNHNKEMKQIIELLRERGAKIDLFTAVVIEDEDEVARQLKASPKSVNSRSPEGYPAFFAAIDVQNMSIFQQFLNANAPEGMYYRNPDQNDEPESEIDIARQRSKDFASVPEKKRLADEILFRLKLRRKR